MMLYEPAQPPRKRARISRGRADYATSAWGVMLRNEQLKVRGSKEAKDFRNRFRVPYEFLPSLVDMGQRWFRQPQRDVAGRDTIPMELQVLAVLQILGRGSCFDDVAQLSGISVPSVHRIFRRFCKGFSSELWSTWVKLPEGEDLKEVMRIYEALGYPGSMGSMDCTHVAWGRCPFSSARLYSGKEKIPSVVYQAITNHSRRILACTKGYPGSRNDKTISRFDSALSRIRKEEPYVSGIQSLLEGRRLKAVQGRLPPGRWRLPSDKDVGPLPEMDVRQVSGVRNVRTRYDDMFGDFREKLVEHFIYKAERRRLAWTYTSTSTLT